MSDTPRWATVDTDGALHVFADEPTIERITAEVQGTPEVISHKKGCVWINHAQEDDNTGQPLQMAPRTTAFLRDTLWPGQRIVGVVAFTGQVDQDGDIESIPTELLTLLRDKFEGV